MNYTTAIFLINTNARAMLCNYEPDAPDKKVMFKTLDQSLAVDDLVVVPTKTRHGMTVSKIIAADVDIDFDSMIPVDWIICKVEMTDHVLIVRREDDAIKVIRSAEQMKKRADLAANLLAASNAALKALPIFSDGSEKPSAIA